MNRHWCWAFAVSSWLVSGFPLGAALTSKALAQPTAAERKHPAAKPQQDAQAHAAPPAAEVETDPIAARKLFLEGRALLDQGQPQKACELLERSQKLAPALGTVLNLGLCHRHSDRLATAHDYYRQAEVTATLAGDTERREFAHEEAAAISALRASLTLRVTGNADVALEVQVDDVLQPRAVWERPMFVDAGEHRVLVRADGYQSWQGSVSVQDGGKYLLVIPELVADASVALAPQSEPRAAVPTPPKVPTTETPVPPAAAQKQAQARDSGTSTGRVLALVTAGAGVAAIGTSLVLGLIARNEFQDSECKPSGVCTPLGFRQRADAHTLANRATFIGVAGGAAVLGGTVLWFLSPEASSAVVDKPLALHVDQRAISAQYHGYF